MLGEPLKKPGELRVIANVPNPDHAEMVDLDKDGKQDLLIADLGDFMPVAGVMDFGSPVTTAHQADDALFYGLHIMLEVGHALAKAAELQLVVPIEVLMRQLDEIAETTIAKTAGYDALPNDASGSDSEAP